jgi:hypothetical protein
MDEKLHPCLLPSKGERKSETYVCPKCRQTWTSSPIVQKPDGTLAFLGESTPEDWTLLSPNWQREP